MNWKLRPIEERMLLRLLFTSKRSETGCDQTLAVATYAGPLIHMIKMQQNNLNWGEWILSFCSESLSVPTSDTCLYNVSWNLSEEPLWGVLFTCTTSDFVQTWKTRAKEMGCLHAAVTTVQWETSHHCWQSDFPESPSVGNVSDKTPGNLSEPRSKCSAWLTTTDCCLCADPDLLPHGSTNKSSELWEWF